MLKKDLEKELERYKKAVQTRDILIRDMKQEMAGQDQVIAILSAYIICLLPDGEEVHIKKNDIKKIIEGRNATLITDASDTDYILKKEFKNDTIEENN